MKSKIQRNLLQTNITTCCYGYKLACVDHKYGKFINYYISEDGFYNFINSTIEQSKYCTDIKKKHFNKELVMTKKDNEDFQNSAKCCDNVYVEGDIKVGDHWKI